MIHKTTNITWLLCRGEYDKVNDHMKSRRQFVSTSAFAAVGFPTIVKASVLGLNGAVAASERISIATIGIGNMGTGGHLTKFSKLPSARIVAVCDLDEERLLSGKTFVQQSVRQFRLRDVPGVRRDPGAPRHRCCHDRDS